MQKKSKKELEPATEPKVSAGQPTKYTPEIAQQILKLSAEGNTIRMCCQKLGVPERTLYQWKDDIPEFSQTMKDSASAFGAFMESQALNNLVEQHKGSRLNNPIWMKIMAARFPEYREQKEEEKSQQPITVVIAPEIAGIGKKGGIKS